MSFNCKLFLCSHSSLLSIYNAGIIRSALRHVDALVAVLEVVLHLTKESVEKTDGLEVEIENVDVRGHAAGTRDGLDHVTESVKGMSSQF